ncbi:MAG: cytochrome c4 [Gammaproteobacteria bacterium]|nr:cytochrome c4 [Gammaproteobacteria bacterium]
MKYIFLIGLFLSFTVSADQQAKMNAMLEARLADAELLKEAVILGKERATICVFCHGENGNSRRDNIPNLADQNAKYLFKQFEMFASGERDNVFMKVQAEKLSSEDRVNIALFFASLKAIPRSEISPDQIAKGRNIYLSQCKECHGKDAHGEELLPRLASQPARYLNKQMNNYRAAPEKRSGKDMLKVVKTLSKEDQAMVAAYLSSLK